MKIPVATHSLASGPHCHDAVFTQSPASLVTATPVMTSAMCGVTQGKLHAHIVSMMRVANTDCQLLPDTPASSRSNPVTPESGLITGGVRQRSFTPSGA